MLNGRSQYPSYFFVREDMAKEDRVLDRGHRVLRNVARRVAPTSVQAQLAYHAELIANRNGLAPGNARTMRDIGVDAVRQRNPSHRGATSAAFLHYLGLQFRAVVPTQRALLCNCLRHGAHDLHRAHYVLDDASTQDVFASRLQGIDAKVRCRLFLSYALVEASFQNVLAEGFRDSLKSLLNQDIARKRQMAKWQKGNASIATRDVALFFSW